MKVFVPLRDVATVSFSGLWNPGRLAARGTPFVQDTIKTGVPVHINAIIHAFRQITDPDVYQKLYASAADNLDLLVSGEFFKAVGPTIRDLDGKRALLLCTQSTGFGNILVAWRVRFCDRCPGQSCKIFRVRE